MAQVSGGQAVPATANGPTIGPQKQSQPMSLLQMLSKSQQEDATRAAQAGMLGSQSPGAPQGPHVPNDLVLKLHQVQQQQHQVVIFV